MKASTGSAVVLILILLIFAITFGPLVAIWAVNKLFAAGVEYTFVNWFAMLVLLALVRAGGSSSKD